MANSFESSYEGSNSGITATNVGRIAKDYSGEIGRITETLTKQQKELIEASKKVEKQNDRLDLVVIILVAMIGAMIIDVLLARVWKCEETKIIERIYEGPYRPTFREVRLFD